MTTPLTGMAKGGRGVGGGGSATLQRSKLNLTQKVRQVEPKLDNSGGDGGMGKGIFNGGGGDGGDGDDDDWFDNFEDGDGDGDEAKSWIRAVVAQLYDDKSINAVLSEWFRTAADLPGILRQSVAMGLFSSAQLVTFLQMDVRPSAARALTRVLPPRVSRDVVGRLMADPAFLQKVGFEQAFAAFGSLRWEYEARGGDRFWRELDLVAVDTLSVCAAALAASWLLAPSRAAPSRPLFGAAGGASAAALPNHAFDASSPARRFSTGGRAASVAARGVELAAVGGATTLAATAATSALVSLRRAVGDKNFVPAAPAPSWSSAATAAAAFGLFSNARLQALGGADRWLFEHARSLAGGLGVSAVLRGTSAYCQHKLRVCAQGLGGVVPAAKAERARLAEEAALPPKARRVVRRRKRTAVPAADPAAAVSAAEGASPEASSEDPSAAAAADVAAAAPVRRRRKKRVASGFEMSASLAA